MSKKEIIVILGCTLILFLIMMCGCCPTITETTQTTKGSDTTYQAGAATVPASEHSHLVNNSVEVCDSLYKVIAELSEKPKPQMENTEPKVVTKFVYKNPPVADKPASSATIEIRDDGKMNIICREEEYLLMIDSLKTVISNWEKTETVKTVAKCDNSFHDFTRWFFFIVVMVAVIYLIAKAR